MDDETEFKLITTADVILTRARRAHESARLAFASFVGGSLGGLLAAVASLLILLSFDRLLECGQLLGFGALAGAGVAIGGYIRIGGWLNNAAEGRTGEFSISWRELLATIVACAGIGSVVSLGFNSQVFHKVPFTHGCIAVGGIALATLFGALIAYAWQVSESRRQAAEANQPGRETGNPYQAPLT